MWRQAKYALGRLVLYGLGQPGANTTNLKKSVVSSHPSPGESPAADTLRPVCTPPSCRQLPQTLYMSHVLLRTQSHHTTHNATELENHSGSQHAHSHSKRAQHSSRGARLQSLQLLGAAGWAGCCSTSAVCSCQLVDIAAWGWRHRRGCLPGVLIACKQAPQTLSSLDNGKVLRGRLSAAIL